MPLPKPVQKQITTLTKKFDKCMDKLERLYSAGRYAEYLALREGELNVIYKDSCALVRKADTTNTPYRAELLDAVQHIIDEANLEDGGLGVGCLTLRIQDYSEGPVVVKDRRMLRNPMARPLANEDEDEDPKPHPRSSPFAIFGFNSPKPTATPANRATMPIYDARCEISSVRDRTDRHFERRMTDIVVDMQISGGGSCLAVLGWVKTRVTQPRHSRRTGKFPAPWISYYFPDDPKSKFTGLMQWGSRFETGLAGVPRQMTLDESQRLIFVADSDRIKSFEWAAANGSFHKRPLDIHTLCSKQFDGRILSLPNGSLIRAGTGASAVWNLNQLKTHRLKDEKLIGEEIYIDDECEYDSDCDDGPHLEYSSGSVHTSKITFVDERKLRVDIWRVLPHSTTVLATGRMERNCVAIDLEHGGKTITRYQGQSNFISDISISAADPHVFLSSCHDGYARLFDVRQGQPVLKFAACKPGESCGPVALTHPDGIPTIFTASSDHQDFKIWDVRSRACVYELGTSEHHDSYACSFAWDSGHNSLYSLRSVYVDSDGYSDDSDDDEGSDYSRIYRYSFKDKPRYAMLPADNPKVDEEAYFEEEYDTDVPVDDSDEDYVH